MRFVKFLVLIAGFSLISCFSNKNDQMALDIQGHRGCRGLYPENTLPAFKHALDLGVTTLEMDLAITADHKVIVSHEPFFNHEISLDPSRNLIAEKDQLEHNIYKMDYEEVKKYDVGLKAHPRFPDQLKIASTKPLLSSVFEMVIEYCQERNMPIPYFNIEIKSKEGREGKFHPPVDTFVDLTMDVISVYNLKEKTTIQSFDTRALNYLHKAYPEVQSVYLIENKLSLEDNLSKLEFIPNIYSPDYALIDSLLIQSCRDKEIKLIPWTVNDTTDMKMLIEMGVDGIITDYPNLLIDLVKR